jgi:acyl carrier protein
VNLEFSDPPGDAPCPNCNHLLWLCGDLLSTFQRQYSQSKGIPPERITADTEFADLGADSLESVELVMAMEEDFGIHLPSAVADHIETIGDAIRYIEEQRRGEKS